MLSEEPPEIKVDPDQSVEGKSRKSVKCQGQTTCLCDSVSPYACVVRLYIISKIA